LVAHYVAEKRMAKLARADASDILGVRVPDLESEEELRAQLNSRV
ncbi:hypothetical protein LCGC14_2352150, partial [marine sediment metagenome]